MILRCFWPYPWTHNFFPLYIHVQRVKFMGITPQKKNTSKPKPFGFGVTPAQKTLPESPCPSVWFGSAWALSSSLMASQSFSRKTMVLFPSAKKIRWFKPWPFWPLVGGHLTFERVTETSQKKVTKTCQEHVSHRGSMERLVYIALTWIRLNFPWQN